VLIFDDFLSVEDIDAVLGSGDRLSVQIVDDSIVMTNRSDSNVLNTRCIIEVVEIAAPKYFEVAWLCGIVLLN
jgi:hypothetical protein